MGYENLPKPIVGKLAGAVAKFAGEMLQELASENERISIKECLEMLTTSPHVAAAADAKILLGLSLWGKYEHPEEAQQAFVRENFECMEGSFEIALAEIYSVMPLGYVASEIAWTQRGAEPASVYLESLMALDPTLYSFRGRRSQIEDVLYRSPVGPQTPIDYKTKILHVVNKPYLAFRNPMGVADCKLAAAAWKAWKIIVSESLVAGQRQATPIIVGTSPKESVGLVKPDGSPLIGMDGKQMMVPATRKMAEALEGLNNNASYLSLSEGSDAKVLNAQTNGQFFLELLEYFQRLMFLAFMVPETLIQVGRGGLGNAGLAGSHLDVMMLQLQQITKQIKGELKEKVVRPLLEWEFGPQENYGLWAEPERGDENKLALFSAITDAIARQTMSAADIEVVNRHRELAGISPVAEIVANVAPNIDYDLEPEAA